MNRDTNTPLHAPVPTEPSRQDLPLALSVPEAGRLLGIGRNTAYDAVRNGEIPSLRIGGRIVVPLQALLRLLDRAGAAG